MITFIPYFCVAIDLAIIAFAVGGYIAQKRYERQQAGLPHIP